MEYKEKVKIGIFKARGTKGNALFINDYRLTGYKSYAYDFIEDFNVEIKDIKEALKIIGSKEKT